MAVIGGIAVNANGVIRTTADIDATTPGADLDISALIRALRVAGIRPRIKDAKRFAHQNQVLLLEHAKARIDVDLSLAWIPFEIEAIERAEIIPFGSARVPVAKPEDLLIYKLIADRPRDVSDAEQLLLLHRSRIDFLRVRRVLQALAEHLDGRDRIAALDEMLARLPPLPARKRSAGRHAR